MNNDNNEKQAALFRALQAGKLHELVAFRGGTGDLRKPLTAKERKAKRKEVKASRQFNRRKGV